MFVNLCRLVRAKLDLLDLPRCDWTPHARHRAEGTARHRADSRRPHALPGGNRRTGPRHQHRHRKQAEAADRAQAYWQSLQDIGDRSCRRAELYAPSTCCDLAGPVTAIPAAANAASPGRPPQGHVRLGAPPVANPPSRAGRDASRAPTIDRSLLTLRQRYQDAVKALSTEAVKLLREWPAAPEVDHRRSHRIRGARQGDHASRTTASRCRTRRSRRSPRRPTRAGASC